MTSDSAQTRDGKCPECPICGSDNRGHRNCLRLSLRADSHRYHKCDFCNHPWHDVTAPAARLLRDAESTKEKADGNSRDRIVFRETRYASGLVQTESGQAWEEEVNAAPPEEAMGERAQFSDEAREKLELLAGNWSEDIREDLHCDFMEAYELGWQAARER